METVRLQKFMADMGVCSRRAAEELISNGEVVVDGKPAQLGQKITPGVERVVVRGKTIKPVARPTLTLLMNKPRGVVCTNSDPFGNRTVFDLLPPPAQKERLFCAGRLDKDSEGMLILTNDGALAQRLTHPSNRVIKRYRVLLTRPFNPEHTRVMLNGMDVEGERLKVERIIQIKRSQAPERDLEVHLEHGRKREIRRLFEALGYRVERLARFQIGRLQLRGVSPGRARPLSQMEIEMLFGG